MTELELLHKIYDCECALFMVLATILLVLGFWFGNRNGK